MAINRKEKENRKMKADQNKRKQAKHHTMNETMKYGTGGGNRPRNDWQCTHGWVQSEFSDSPVQVTTSTVTTFESNDPECVDTKGDYPYYSRPPM